MSLHVESMWFVKNKESLSVTGNHIWDAAEVEGESREGCVPDHKWRS